MTLASFKFNKKQIIANRLLGSDARHILLYGGSRSGKTFIILRAIVTRALAVPGSRHAVLRFRFNHVKLSIVYDTLPKMLELCFPGLAEKCNLDKTDWFYRLPNGSEIWFGGLDDKERTEKILGQEYASIFLNECSQIPWASRNIAITRLAQKTALRLKIYYDCNPPSEGHWTYKLFMAKKHPDQAGALKDPENYAALQINPKENEENLADGYLQELSGLPERARKRFLEGLFGSANEGALWTEELLDQCRYSSGELPTMQRILIAVDPSGCAGQEDIRSDEVGIVVCGLADDGRGYVLEDLSGRFGPAQWGQIVGQAFERHSADAVIAETNFGGAMVEEVIKAARPGTPIRLVTASRGKVVRAEPISALFEQKKIMLAGYFPNLEEQLCAMTTAGYVGSKSPDRADAMIWGFTSLFPSIARKPELLDRVVRQTTANVGYSNSKRHRRR